MFVKGIIKCKNGQTSGCSWFPAFLDCEVLWKGWVSAIQAMAGIATMQVNSLTSLSLTSRSRAWQETVTSGLSENLRIIHVQNKILHIVVLILVFSSEHYYFRISGRVNVFYLYKNIAGGSHRHKLFWLVYTMLEVLSIECGDRELSTLSLCVLWDMK